MKARHEVLENLTKVSNRPDLFVEKLKVEMLLDIRDILNKIRESLRIISLKP